MMDKSFLDTARCINCEHIVGNEDGYRCTQIGDEVKKEGHCGYFTEKMRGLDIKKNPQEEEKQLAIACEMDLAKKQTSMATERIAKYIEDNNYIRSTLDDIRSEVWFYDNGIYKPNGESKIKEITRKILKENYTTNRANTIIEKIKADTHVDTHKFFNTNYLEEIPVQNGILNIITLKLCNFTPTKIFFNKLPVEFKPEAKCPNIKQFLKDVLKKPDNVLVIEEFFGYCLYKEHFIEKAVMFVGDGRNGKGKTLSLLKSFIGAENCCSVSLSQMVPTSTSVCELHGKLANLAGDLSNTSLKNTGMFKEITGRDMIGAKRKYLRDLFFTNYSKQVFACNELPRVYDTSDGFWERWLLFEFPYKFVDKKVYYSMPDEDRKTCKIKDVDIIKKITTADELSGLLNEALKGLKRIMLNKGFSYSKSLKDVKNMWVRKSDSFEAFCMDHIEEGIDYILPKKILRKQFSEYCRAHNIRGASDKVIKFKLEDRYGVSDEQVSLKEYGYGDWESIWLGIRLKEGPKFKKTSLGVQLDE